MARIHMIKKARKQTQCCKCNKIIEVGMSYLKATPYHRRPIIRCTECGLESYETSGSDYIRNVGDIANHWEENFGLSEGVHDDIASELEEIRDQQQESLDNMPESLQEGDTGMMLQERIECLDNVIDELNNVSYEECESSARDEVETELGEYDPENDEYESEEDYNQAFDEEAESRTEEMYRNAIEEALSGLEY